jgi:conjugal transfer mating pair stabilization protein TraG
MASHLGNVSQGAAGQAASEITSGNLSYGNVSQGNMQIANQSMLSHSMGASYKGASASIQDGRAEITTMSDGTQVMNVGNSNVPISINRSESITAQNNEMASKSLQNSLSQSESYSQNLSSAARSSVSLGETVSQLESKGDNANLGITTEQSQALQQTNNLVKEFSNQTGIDVGKSEKLLINAAFGNKGGTGLLSGSVGMDGQINASEQENHNKAQKFLEDHNFQEAVRTTAQAAKQVSHSLNNESASRLAEDVSGSYEQGMNQRNEAAKSFRAAQDYSAQANYAKANSATINANYNQQFGEWLANHTADNTNGGTIGAHAAAHILAKDPKMAMAYAQRFQEEQGLASTNTIPSGDSLKTRYDQEKGHQVYAVTKDSLNAVREQGADLYQSTQANISQGKATRTKVDAMQAEHNQKIDTGASSVKNQGTDLKQAVHAEQNKGVTRRLGAKAGAEAANTAGDVWRSITGKGQQPKVVDHVDKDTSNIKVGESQQK